MTTLCKGKLWREKQQQVLTGEMLTPLETNPTITLSTTQMPERGPSRIQLSLSSLPPPSPRLFLSVDAAVPPVSPSACVVPGDRYSVERLCTHRDIWFGELTSGRCYCFRDGHSPRFSFL